MKEPISQKIVDPLSAPLPDLARRDVRLPAGLVVADRANHRGAAYGVIDLSDDET